MLSIDNLLDLTHEIYIHASTLAADSITENPMKTTRTESSVSIERWMIGEDPGVLWSRALWGDAPPEPRRADRWQIVHYFPPSHTLLDVGAAPAGTGAPEGDRARAAEARIAITLTPIDETRSVYYWMFPNNFTRDRAMADLAAGSDLRRLCRGFHRAGGAAEIDERPRGRLEDRRQRRRRPARRAQAARPADRRGTGAHESGGVAA